MFIHGVIIGLFFGGCIGIVGAAMLCAARDASLDMDSFLDDREDEHD